LGASKTERSCQRRSSSADQAVASTEWQAAVVHDASS
jgi:hypothetical protein